MGLLTSAGQGPTHPDSVTPDRPTGGAANEYLPTPTVAKMLLSRWVNKPTLLDTCSRMLDSDFRQAYPGGDKKRVPRRDRHRVTNTFPYAGTVQPELQNWVDIEFDRPMGIHSEKNVWNTPLYEYKPFERMRDEDKMDRLIDEIEIFIGSKMAAGYHRAMTPFRVTSGTLSAPTQIDLTVAGKDSGDDVSKSDFTDIHALMDIKSDFYERGINDRVMCAALDTRTRTSIARVAALTGYGQPMGRQAWRAGDMGSNGVGWMTKTSIYNGETYFNGVNAAITVTSAPAEGATAITLKKTNGQGVKENMRFQVEDCHAVNEVTGNAVPGLMSWRATANQNVAGTDQPVNVDPPVRFAANTTDAGRRRTCSVAPAAGKKVYIEGLDTSIGGVRSKYDGKRLARSIFMAENTCFVIMMDPDLPASGNDNVRARMIRNRSYGIAFALQMFYDAKEGSLGTNYDYRVGAAVLEPEAGYYLNSAVTG